jgi:hypothetical protein
MSRIRFIRIAFTALSVCLLALSFAPNTRSARLPKANPEPGPLTDITANFIGLGGMAFQPGQPLQIKWNLEGSGVKPFEVHPWSECELFFSPDGGNTWTRISPGLSVSRRSFDWVVPNSATQQGIIALQIGIEGEGEFYFLPSTAFTVLPGRR